MSNVLMNLAWPLEMEPMAKLVLIALADRASDKEGGVCWPGLADLELRTGASRRTIQRAIRGLESSGHITRKEVPGKGCRYTVHPRHSDTPPCQSDTPTHVTVTPDPCQSDTQTLIEPSEEPSEEPSLSARAREVCANADFTADRLVEAWNLSAKRLGLPVVRSLCLKDRKALDEAMAYHPDPKDWREAFEAIGDSKFLLGEKSGFRATFRWLLKPSIFDKVLEGSYDDGPDPRSDGMDRALDRSPTPTQRRNARRRRRTDFQPDDLVPEIDRTPKFDLSDIPF